MKKIAIVGSGISGLTCAYLLNKKYQVTLFEANDYLGGHTATKQVEVDGNTYAIDTGFIVFNEKTYPNFLKLLDHIGIEKQDTEMSFSARNVRTGLEYNGHTINTLFAQRSNLFNPRFYKFIFEILRFNKRAKALYERGEVSSTETLEDFIKANGFSNYFCENYILPMIAAIWSSSMNEAMEFPLQFFLRFFVNHGLLNVNDRPQWYVVKGGSNSYIPKLIEGVEDIRLNTPINRIERLENGIIVHANGLEEQFDEVILATHSDQALRLLESPTRYEQEVLGDLEYRMNDVILHTDTSWLPKRKLAWASWNYKLSGDNLSPPCVTYNMNILQGIEAPETFCVTLNPNEDIAQSKILGAYKYTHPVYNLKTIEAQAKREHICGKNHTHFCGAYWYNGFHEDGLRSALDVCSRFGATL